MASAPISDDQWEHMLEAWRIFDTDGDGMITSADLKTVLLSFGYDHSIEVRRGKFQANAEEDRWRGRERSLLFLLLGSFPRLLLRGGQRAGARVDNAADSVPAHARGLNIFLLPAAGAGRLPRQASCLHREGWVRSPPRGCDSKKLCLNTMRPDDNASGSPQKSRQGPACRTRGCDAPVPNAQGSGPSAVYLVGEEAGGEDP